MSDAKIYNPFSFSLDDAEYKKLGELFLTWSHIEHLIANCLKAALNISDDEAIKQVHNKTFDERMVHLRKLSGAMNDDAKAAFF